MSENQASLFDIPADNSRSEPAMLTAAKTYIKSLESQKLLKPDHILTVQAIYALAEAIGKAAAKGQASAMSFASKELREYMGLLPQPVSMDSFTEFMDKMTKAGNDRKNDDIYA
ncbi:hypothetical protein PP340_gp01 [Arthrobacter phage Adaia]|uniref:Uncharacterized protein n=1 Tax=Arthrobacter phage Adaia TaxID=2419945 RepID=A0A3G2KCZ7_9CAUD|nr:hypothetical protein PP340_gp01 [Arthrobacter phage Adaia]AYN56790.1 hypothetical protein PBI_ADAIA_1 [Arthrobacter phage Adaia]